MCDGSSVSELRRHKTLACTRHVVLTASGSPSLALKWNQQRHADVLGGAVSSPACYVFPVSGALIPKVAILLQKGFLPIKILCCLNFLY
jgi:hypothetical protein